MKLETTVFMTVSAGEPVRPDSHVHVWGWDYLPDGQVRVGTATVEIEVDPKVVLSDSLAAIDKTEKEVEAEYSKKKTELAAARNNLLAITYEA